MLALALAALSLQSAAVTPELREQANSVMEVPDRVVSSLVTDQAFDVRGLIVSDDGLGIYTPHMARLDEPGKVRAVEGHHTRDGQGAWGLTRELTLVLDRPKQPLLAELFFQGAREKHKKTGQVLAVIAARNKGELVLLYRSREGEPVKLGSATTPGESQPTHLYADGSVQSALADVSSQSLLVLQKSRWNLVGRGAGSGPANGNGVVPFAYDSAHDAILCYTYGEHGSPLDLRFRPVANADKWTVLPATPGGVRKATLLRGKRTLIWTRGREHSDPRPAGLYLLPKNGTEWKHLGPYSLEGSSADGEFALISHLEQRRSWIVGFKDL